MTRRTFLKNAAVVSFGGLAAKAIGVFYRIPLSNLLGGYGMGLYQMTYPLFCLLLTFSSAGIPSAFSRMIAREAARGGEGEAVRAALRLFALLGAAGSALMCLFAPAVASLQGEAALVRCYLSLAPSVFLVALIAVLRGYFQGKSEMKPTALSEIAEQTVKVALGLPLACRFAGDPVRAVSWTLFSVTLSEGAALCYLALRYRAEGIRPRRLAVRRVGGAEVLGAALPVMAATAVLPLSQVADSVILVRLLARTGSAVSLYGLFAGGALSLVNLPATVCYGLAAASVPAVARGNAEEARQRSLYALGVTLLLSAVCAAFLALFAPAAVSVLYRALSAEDAATLVRLVRMTAVSAVTIAATDTLAACLTGMGRAKCAALSMLASVAAKTAAQLFFVPALGVAGAAVAENCCFLVAFSLDLFYTVRKPKERRYDHSRESRNGAGRLDPAGESGT